jgi:hypothetical protein
MKQSEIRITYTEDKTLLRSIEQYHSDLQLGNISLTGVKERCVWLDVKGFSLFDQVAVDMHDMLEGCCKYIIGFLVSLN